MLWLEGSVAAAHKLRCSETCGNIHTHTHPRGGPGNPLQYSGLENPHGQRSLTSYSPRGCTESDMTKHHIAYTHINICVCVCALSRSVVSDSLQPHWTGNPCCPPGSSVHGDSLGQNAGVGCRALLQGIVPTRESNPGLPHCRWILYHLSHQESPYIYNFILFIFGHAGTSLLLRLFSNRGVSGLPFLAVCRASHWGGFSCCGAQAVGPVDFSSCSVVPGLQSRGSVVVVHRLSSSAACGIFPDQGSNLRFLHWQVDS